MSGSELASLKEVWKSYRGEDYVLRGVNLSVGQGEFLAIHGRSGSGKSTLLRIIGLLDRPDRGEVRLVGRDTSGLSYSQAASIRLESVGFVFQALNLIPHITVLENIEIPMWMKGAETDARRRRGMELLTHFGLQRLADRKPPEISMGEQQRVAAIRALVNAPKIILADEPTAHLDDQSAELLLELFSKLNSETGVAVVMTTTSQIEAGTAGRSLTLAGGGLS